MSSAKPKQDDAWAEEPPATFDRRLRDRGISLRAAAREIPLVFGSFFE